MGLRKRFVVHQDSPKRRTSKTGMLAKEETSDVTAAMSGPSESTKLPIATQAKDDLQDKHEKDGDAPSEPEAAVKAPIQAKEDPTSSTDSPITKSTMANKDAKSTSELAPALETTVNLSIKRDEPSENAISHPTSSTLPKKRTRSSKHDPLEDQENRPPPNKLVSSLSNDPQRNPGLKRMKPSSVLKFSRIPLNDITCLFENEQNRNSFEVVTSVRARPNASGSDIIDKMGDTMTNKDIENAAKGTKKASERRAKDFAKSIRMMR
ncbi:hypothetical protein HDU97_001203 [Phlyctochytrium planicorne]|nr:hypothetical protein HDU97_001203 [Phlyctochytrium planicorne]